MKSKGQSAMILAIFFNPRLNSPVTWFNESCTFVVENDSMSGVIAYLIMLGGAFVAAVVLAYGLRAVKLI